MRNMLSASLCILVVLWLGTATTYSQEDAAKAVEHGNALLKRGRYDAAVEAFSTALSAMTAGDPSTHPVLLARAEAAFRLEDLEKALEDAHSVADADPGNEEAKAWTLMLRGLICNRDSRPSEALSFLTAAIKSMHENSGLRAASFAGRGLVFLNLSRPDEAISDLNKTLQLEPSSASAHSLRAKAYSLKGEVDKARRDSEEAVVRNSRGSERTAWARTGPAATIPKPPPSQANVTPAGTKPAVLLKRAVDSLNNNQLDAAWNDATFVLNSGNTDGRIVAQALIVRSHISNRQGHREQALADLTEAIKAPHTDKRLRAGSLVERGKTFLRFAQPEKAIADLDKAMEWDPQSGLPYAIRCEACLTMDRMDQAKRDCDQALAKKVSGTWAGIAADRPREMAVQPSGPRTVTIPMDRQGRMYVHVKFSKNGTPHRFLLDTGASGSLIDRELLEKIRRETHVQEVGRGTSRTADGTTGPITLYHVAGAFLYNLPLGDMEVQVLDRQQGRIEHLLGTRDMQSLKVNIDNAKRIADITLLK